MADGLMTGGDTGPNAMSGAEDNSAIEGALTAIEQAVADIRASISKEGTPTTAPGNPGAMATPPVPPAAGGGKNSMKSFMGM